MSIEDRKEHYVSTDEIKKAFIKSLKINNNDPKNEKAKKKAEELLKLQGKMHDAGEPYGEPYKG